MLKFVTRTALGLCAAAAVSLSAWAQDLTIGLGANVTSIDPHFHNLSPNNSVAVHIFGRLIEQDEKQRLMPGLATSWKAIDDKTWEFKLRKGVKFHDGCDFTAEDVVSTLKRVPKVPNSPASFATTPSAIAEADRRRSVHDPLQDRGAVSAAAERPVDDLHRQRRRPSRRRPTTSTPARRRSAPAPTSSSSTCPATASCWCATTATGATSRPGTKVTFKLITNNAARVAALLSGDVEMIEQLPTADVAQAQDRPERSRCRRRSRTASSTCTSTAAATSRPFVTAKDGKPLDKNPLQDVRVRQRDLARRSTARRSPTA